MARLKPCPRAEFRNARWCGGARLLVRRDWYFARLLVMQDYSSDGTGTLQEPVITIPFRPYSCAAGNYSVCLFEASTGLSGVSQPLQCEMVE